MLIALWQLIIGCEPMCLDQPSNGPEAIFENLWTTFKEEYAVFEERNVDWHAAYHRFRPLINTHTTENELYLVLTQMLGKLDDGHVSLTTPGRNVFYANHIRNNLVDDKLFDLSVIKSYLAPGYAEGSMNSYLYGKIKNTKIGYIYFNYIEDNFLKMDDFLAEYERMEGYIIDLRHNEGGDFTYSFPQLGRFTDQSRYVFKSRTKNGPRPADFTAWHKWYVHPRGEYINKPLVVLVDRYTISAGERTVMGLKTIPTATIVGDTTNGAHGTMIGRELANGWFYTLVTQQTELFDGYTYEGKGLPPDLFSKNSLSEIENGQDKTLELAMTVLNP